MIKINSILVFVSSIFLLTACSGFDSTTADGQLGQSNPNPPPPPPPPNACGGLREKCGDAVTLSWTKPTKNTDGSDLTDLVGFKIFYGGSSRTYSTMINYTNLTRDIYDLSGLAPGQYYFSIKAVSSTADSDYSAEGGICLKTCAEGVRSAYFIEYPNSVTMTLFSN